MQVQGKANTSKNGSGKKSINNLAPKIQPVAREKENSTSSKFEPTKPKTPEDRKGRSRANIV